MKSETRTYTLVGQQIKATSKTVEADSKITNGAWIVVYDGKDRRETSPGADDTLSVKQTDPYHATSIEKKDGKIIATGTRVISLDGTTMTITNRGLNAKRQTVADVLVYDKK